METCYEVAAAAAQAVVTHHAAQISSKATISHPT